jgi:hypothetical protein
MLLDNMALTLPALPGDVVDLARRSGPFLQQARGLLVPFLGVKYGPYRDVVEAVWTEATANGHKVANGLLQDVQILQDALRRLDPQPLPTPWACNVGRNNTHHSGLIRMADTSLGMVSGSSNLER